jgi:hypothetical protein
VDQPAPPVIRALNPVVAALEELGLRYHVGGSVASSLHGIPRSTVDVDLVAEIQLSQIDRIVSLLQDATLIWKR